MNKITADYDYVSGHLRYGHLELELNDEGELIIDDFEVNDRGDLGKIEY
jgi:hypothetical protein